MQQWKTLRDCLLCLESTNDLFDFPSRCWLITVCWFFSVRSKQTVERVGIASSPSRTSVFILLPTSRHFRWCNAKEFSSPDDVCWKYFKYFSFTAQLRHWREMKKFQFRPAGGFEEGKHESFPKKSRMFSTKASICVGSSNVFRPTARSLVCVSGSETLCFPFQCVHIFFTPKIHSCVRFTRVAKRKICKRQQHHTQKWK